MIVYWWALGLAIIVLGASLYVGKRKGLNKPWKNSSRYLTGNRSPTKEEINLDEQIEQ